MSRVFVSGWGAVSPAGWGVAPFREALQRGLPLPSQPLVRPGWEQPLAARLVPAPAARPAFLSHPRLRRSSLITQYAGAAALEALGTDAAGAPAPQRFGLILCLQSGCVQYSHRFYTEVLENPATASPLLFPETVFAGPASHVAALLPAISVVHTLVGDPAMFLQGVALGADWIAEEQVDGCLVVGAEETNWLLADAVWQFDHRAMISAGAGALCLRAGPGPGLTVELNGITSAHTYVPPVNRAAAALRMRRELPAGGPSELLCDGLQNRYGTDAAEAAVWRDWPGPRLSPKLVLGEGLMAAGAWQCVAACDALLTLPVTAALASLVGSNQQAIGARFVRAGNGAGAA